MVKAFRELGHEVEIVSLVKTERESANPGREGYAAWWQHIVRRVPFGYELIQLAYNAISIPILLWKVSQSAPDFLYERYSLLNFTGVIVARIAKQPIVLEVNSPFAIEQGREGYIRAVAVAQWVEKTICNSATHVVVVNESLRAIMIAIGVEEQRLVVMHNGVNLSHFARRNTSSLRARFGLENKLVFGFVGWLRKQHCLVDRRTGLSPFTTACDCTAVEAVHFYRLGSIARR